MAEPVLQVQGITRAFGALVASDNVSLDLREGEIHALIGPNGAGKSTLIALISGALAPDAGQIRFNGRDVTALDTVARARLGLGRSFQISAVVPEFTVLQNVVLAAQGAAGHSYRLFRPALKDRSATSSARAQIARVGLEARAAIPAADLAHGERRRLELAMALALKPKAFLLDEPMAGLGADGTAQMTTLLETLKAEAPILLVEHDMDAVFRLADRISVLDYGRIIATGSVEEIRQDPEVRRAYLGADA
ncbi:ABC transporter ATP-binding protein [Oceanibium sediminis]|uniref:ABC transporter ATP-binding protein n=1 Tax=Oceanibium sediminis TaxID=2026339 RepID=UPI000DD3D2D8|nr:ABC transporter ATP-binding protein [Oceanibium sediminis]